MIQRYEIEAWLSGAVADMTPDQIDAFERLARQWEATAGDVTEDETAAAWAAIHEAVTGQGSVTQAAAADQAAQLAAAEARARLRATVLAAADSGLSESEAARQAGVTRMTVRAWLGK